MMGGISQWMMLFLIFKPHGLIHCNGFGHLLCINGIEGGSKYLCGREIMDLWDRICTFLQTRSSVVRAQQCFISSLLFV